MKTPILICLYEKNTAKQWGSTEIIYYSMIRKRGEMGGRLPARNGECGLRPAQSCLGLSAVVVARWLGECSWRRPILHRAPHPDIPTPTRARYSSPWPRPVVLFSPCAVSLPLGAASEETCRAPSFLCVCVCVFIFILANVLCTIKVLRNVTQCFTKTYVTIQ